MGITYMSLLFSVEEIFANQNTHNDMSTEYELVCELVELENGDTTWSCSWVTVQDSISVSVMGSGVSGEGTRVYLMCYEHYSNGRPTGETMKIRVL